MSRTTDEALARVEHKVDVTLDLLMELIGKMNIIRITVPKMGDGMHDCPICGQMVRYVVDLVGNGSVTAQCGCKTGKFAPLNLEQFAPPRAAGDRNAQREGHGNASDEGDAEVGEREHPKGSRRG